MQEKVIGLLFEYPPQIIFLVLLHGTSWYHTVIINYLRDANLRERKDIQDIKNQENREQAMRESQEDIMTRFKIIDLLMWPVKLVFVDIFILFGRIFASHSVKNLLILDVVIVAIFAIAQILFVWVFLCSYSRVMRVWFQRNLKNKYKKDFESFFQKS